MPTANLKLKIENCRAVHSAEIELSEITVLAGVNASGKSTIARIFHELIGYSTEYERLLAENLVGNFNNEYGRALQRVVFEIWRHDPKSFRGKFTEMPDGNSGIVKAAEKIKILIDYVSSGIETLPFEKKERALAFLFRAIGATENETIQNVITKINAALDEMLQSHERYIQHRDYRFCRDRRLEGQILADGDIDLHEGDNWICSFRKKDDKNCQDGKNNGEVLGIKQAFYIESPFKNIPRKTEDNLEINDGFAHPRLKPFSKGKNASDDLFSVLHGRITSEENENRRSRDFGEQAWVYQREDGVPFDLKECATGIRSLSVLNILYENGWLDDETLLIIDEPEAHLHPQWVVEYARILVLLSKKLKVRLLLTSHSPEMINALDEIAKKEDMEGKIRFYLAEKAEGQAYQFDYRSLGNQTSDIFKTFNVAFRLITDYAQ